MYVKPPSVSTQLSASTCLLALSAREARLETSWGWALQVCVTYVCKAVPSSALSVHHDGSVDGVADQHVQSHTLSPTAERIGTADKPHSRKAQEGKRATWCVCVCVCAYAAGSRLEALQAGARDADQGVQTE